MAEEPELASLERGFKVFEEQPAIQPRKYMDREEDIFPAAPSREAQPHASDPG
jgi:hypothetical protein